MADPTKPHVVSVKGGSSSVAGDTIRVTVYSGSTARGTTTGVLDSNKKLVLNLADSISTYAQGDTIVISENGKGLGSTSKTISGGGTDVSISATTVAFPSRSL